MLIHFKVTPILVFDGAELPMKADTHNERRERREEAMRKAEHAFATGDRKRAEEWYQRAYTVTSEMARLVIRECRKINVEYIVAPYEADAQLAWMMKTGYIDGVITEDSDMLVYGANKILFKMNRFGNGDLFERKNLLSLDSLNMNNFTDDMFMYMSVCSGCDFFKGVQGLGVKKSHAVVKRFRTMRRLVLAIRQDRRYKVQKSFAEDFARACLVFRHQTVFDMRSSQHIHLNEFDEEAKAMLPPGVLQSEGDNSIDLSFLGTHRDTDIAKKIAAGLIHPKSLEEYIDPLDVVSRPVTNRVRPQSFPSPPRRRQAQPPESQNVRGFQVQPVSNARRISTSTQASSAMAARYASSMNLRQRLSGRQIGPQTFNPRRAGAMFRTKQAEGDSSSGIWATFKSSRDLLRIPDKPLIGQTGDNDAPNIHATPSHETVTKKGDAFDEKENTPPILAMADITTQPPGHVDNERSESSSPDTPASISDEERLPQQDPNPHEEAKPPEVLSTLPSAQTPKRRRVSSSHRVEAMNRAIGRFAQKEKRHISEKFLPTRKCAPSSEGEGVGPDESNVSSLNCTETEHRSPKKVKAQSLNKTVIPSKLQTTPKSKTRSKPQTKPKAKLTSKSPKTLKAKPVTQVRLSRFFQPLKEKGKEGTSNENDSKSSLVRSTKKTLAQSHGIQKARRGSGLTSLNKYKRGATGKTAVARRKQVEHE